MQTLRSLRKKIDNLESEKANLLEEIEKLKKAGEEKADALEQEVATLRKEMESLKELINATKNDFLSFSNALWDGVDLIDISGGSQMSSSGNGRGVFEFHAAKLQEISESKEPCLCSGLDQRNMFCLLK